MSSRWRRHHRHEPADLDITAFMNLMVILVPFLLITAVFSRMVVLELNLPSSTQTSDAVPETPQIEVIVRADRIEIGERDGGLLTGLARADGEYDYAGLSEYLTRIKVKYPDKTDATILLEPNIEYDVLVQVMDAVRVFEAVDGDQRVKAELFPEISIGDAPAARSVVAQEG